MPTISTKHPWEQFRLKKIGNVADVVRGGGGKLSIQTDDSGDIFSPPGQETP